MQADGSLSVTLPVNSDVVPPGDWMLFAIGNNGTPSIASTIHVNPYLSLSNALGTDTGSTATITSGGTTKDNTLALSGTLSVAKGFSSVQVYDGATLLGPATISSGNWSYTTAALLAGSHSFTAKATDNAGNTTNANLADLVGSYNRTGKVGNDGAWFDTSAFQFAPMYTYGNSETRTLIMPGLFNIDFNVKKAFTFSEARRLEFRAEFFNVMNHTNFSTPNLDPTSTNFGRVTSQNGNGRVIQLNLRMEF